VCGVDGTLISYRAWLTGVPASVAADTARIRSEISSIPPHIAEAFAGANPRVIVAGQQAYVLDMLRSRSYTMGSADFVAWMRAQPAAYTALQRVATYISQANELNGREPVSVDEVESYLVSPAGEEFFDLQADNLVREVQIAVRASGQQLVMSDDGWFTAPADTTMYMGGIDADEQLELLGDVTAADLAAIFDAQLCGADVWAAVRGKLVEMGLTQDLAAVPVDGLTMLHRVLLGEMQGVCLRAGVEVIRPPAFRDRLGTFIDHMSESDRVEYIPRSEQLRLTDNAHQWECWCLREIGPAPTVADNDKPAVASVIAKVLKTLDAIADFAERMESGYAEAFSLAAWILRSPDALALLRPETRDAVLGTLSDRARNALSDCVETSDNLSAVGYDEGTRRALLAYDVASVFGGMGSWNDEVPPEALADKYEVLTASLFDDLEQLCVAVI
jgi:hypothetical protein